MKVWRFFWKNVLSPVKKTQQSLMSGCAKNIKSIKNDFLHLKHKIKLFFSRIDECIKIFWKKCLSQS